MEENGETVFDTESIFLRIMMVGQQRHLQLAPIFSYQLCAVPPTLADEFGCLRRGNKAALMNRLGIKLAWPRSPDVVIDDGQQLLYHVTWPCGGDPSVLVASMKARLASLPVCSGVFFFFFFFKKNKLYSTPNRQMYKLQYLTYQIYNLSNYVRTYIDIMCINIHRRYKKMININNVLWGR